MNLEPSRKAAYLIATAKLSLAALVWCQATLVAQSESAPPTDLPTSPAVILPANQSEPNEDWIPLFNGKDLDDWIPKFATHALGENYRNTFRVEDGLLKVSYADWENFNGEFGHLFYKTPYSNYRLRVEYRFVGEQLGGGPEWAFRNNGIMIHGQAPDTMNKDQPFPNSIEVQLLGATGDKKRSTLNVCTPGTQIVVNGKLEKNHTINFDGPSFSGDQWVSFEIEVHHSKSIKHFVGGKVIAEYEQPQLDDGTLLNSGSISIQAETHPTEFRKIELLPLSE